MDYLSSNLNNLLKAIFSPSPNITHAIVLVVFSLIIGLIISSIRMTLLDNFQYWTGIKKEQLDYSKLVDKGKLNLYNAAINNIFRFCQFYGNMFISFSIYLMFYLLKKHNYSSFKPWLIIIITISIMIILYISHRALLKQMNELIKRINKKIV